MNEEQSNYKVTDRRLFNADGTPREVPIEERPVVKPEPEVASPAPVASEPSPPELSSADSSSSEPSKELSSELSSEPSTESGPAVPASADSTASEPVAESEADLAELDDPAGFANFLMSIASNAASSLGMMEHPVTHKREVDLELGKHWIDVLGMLEHKTRGNLLPQEQQILEGLLADLRMQYVSLTNAVPQSKKFSSQDITGG